MLKTKPRTGMHSPAQYSTLGSWPILLAIFAIAALHADATSFLQTHREVSLTHQLFPRFPHLLVSHTGGSGARLGSYGFDEAGQDKSIRAGDDFFGFANGKYIENLKMPEDQASWGSFDILNEESLKRVQGILEDDEKAGGKMGRFYASYMNKKLVDSLDVKPIKSTLDRVAAIRDKAEYASLVGSSTHTFLPSPFAIGIEPDAKDVDSYCVMVDQSGLGLPRDYYLESSYAAKKAAYKKYAATLLDMVGWPDATKSSADIIELEEKLANVSWSEADQRDPIRNYNVMASIADLQSQAPGFDWATFLKDAGNLPGSSKLIVGAIGGVIGMAKILDETDLAVLRSYTAFHLVAGTTSILSDRFVNASFEFSKVMSGKEKLSPRWKRAVGSLNSYMGEEVGKEYVKKYFPASSKRKVEDLTQELKKAFKKHLERSSWMTASTKKKALNKLSSFSIQVGYPKKFRNYTNLKVSADDLYGNIARSVSFNWEWDLGKLGKPVDRDEWAMSPQEVNAYNMPMFNQVVFPAAILQPPFFDPEADMAVNYGGIGGVIGHEMTHGFDDQGRHFDERGQMEDWWTPADAKEFQKRADAYGKQFAEFDLGVPGAHIKADLTMGEDIADLGGLNLALSAYLASVANNSSAPAAHIEGTQRVFLGWAQVWREKKRPDALLNQLASDPHPPAKARVDIPCRNIAEWYEAFDVKPRDKLFLPEKERVVIW